MKLRVMTRGAALFLALALIFSVSSAQAAAKNVILMISDGWGYNQISATDYYNGTAAAYESFAVQYAMSTYSYNNIKAGWGGYDTTKAWTDFNYVKNYPTDSASAATAMATGVKIYDGVLNIDPSGNKLTTITEIAAQCNKSSGVVTSVEFSHATPAGMYAHNTSRNNYAEIANEMLAADSPLSVIMGAGNPNYNDNGQYVFNTTSKSYQYVGGEATWNSLRSNSLNDWTLIESKAAFEALATTATTPEKVVGVAEVATTLQQARTPAPKANEPVLPSNDTPQNTTVPTLAVMTQGALNVLDTDSDGFFLMIEGGAVDWANHANQLGRLIEEQTDFNKAVDAAIAWVEANSSWDETLLIVTGDHECGYLTKAAGSFDAVEDNGAGNLPTGYFNSGNHTNSLIPVYAKGAGSELFALYADEEDLVRGLYIDNTEIFAIMKAQICPTPIPGSLLLMGSGVMGMILIGIRRKCS